MITARLSEIVDTALRTAARDGLLPADEVPEAVFERPRKREHGDWATNVALVAGRGRGNPRSFAEAIIERLPDTDLIERVEVAGPGFLNFHLSPSWLHDVVSRAADTTVPFARSSEGKGQRVNVEYVSANPTGPINVVSGRHAAVGDAIANLFEASGHEVVREYYANDAGRQTLLFAQSVAARYLESFGVEASLPEDGYKGDYIADIAADIAEEIGDSLVEVDDDQRVEKIRSLAVERMLESIKASLAAFGTTYDVWFSEKRFHDDKEVEAALDALRSDGLLEERDGALWFLSSRFGDDKDRVVVRANGEPTYLASDLAYIRDKFRRGFDRVLYLWGADHHGMIPRLHAAAEAFKIDRARVEVEIVQIVTLSQGGESLKASKRAGVIVPLDELVQEVGADATRYTFLTRSIESSLDFDVDLVKEQAPENPVYYVQYAHARICSILRKAADSGADIEPQEPALARLVEPAEDTLMRKLASYEEVVPDAARMRSPQRITRFVEELAADFSAFYRDCRVVSEDQELTGARIALCRATKRVIADGLGLVGVSAPERM